MTPRNIREQLARDESRKLIVYLDSLGIETVGIGHKVLPHDNLRVGDHISDARCDHFFDEDCHTVDAEIDAHFPWAKHLDDARRGVLQNMMFNMGLGRVQGFKKMLAALEHADWATAAREMINSRWANQVGERAIRLAEQMEFGVWK